MYSCNIKYSLTRPIYYSHKTQGDSHDSNVSISAPLIWTHLFELRIVKLENQDAGADMIEQQFYLSLASWVTQGNTNNYWPIAAKKGSIEFISNGAYLKTVKEKKLFNNFYIRLSPSQWTTWIFKSQLNQTFKNKKGKEKQFVCWWFCMLLAHTHTHKRRNVWLMFGKV